MILQRVLAQVGTTRRFASTKPYNRDAADFSSEIS